MHEQKFKDENEEFLETNLHMPALSKNFLKYMYLFIFHMFIIILLLIISVITAYKTGIKVGMNNTQSIDYGYIFFILKNKIKV